MVSARLAFATSVGYQTNMRVGGRVGGPGGPRFSELAKVGLARNISTRPVVCAPIPLIWPL